jgi:hypothetical protein
VLLPFLFALLIGYSSTGLWDLKMYRIRRRVWEHRINIASAKRFFKKSVNCHNHTQTKRGRASQRYQADGSS